jgi:hypothetical protein
VNSSPVDAAGAAVFLAICQIVVVEMRREGAGAVVEVHGFAVI